MALRVAELTSEAPVLAVAIAAVELHRRACRLDTEPAQTRLRRGHEDAAESRAVVALRRGRALEAECECGFELRLQIDELFAHEREINEEPAAYAAVMRPDRRLQE